MVCTKVFSVFADVECFSSHSHTTITFHPSSVRSLWFFESRSIFPPIFFFQNSALFFGHTKYRQPSCACQKQSFTKITVLTCGNKSSVKPAQTARYGRNETRQRGKRTVLSDDCADHWCCKMFTQQFRVKDHRITFVTRQSLLIQRPPVIKNLTVAVPLLWEI